LLETVIERRVIERKHEILCLLIDYWKSGYKEDIPLIEALLRDQMALAGVAESNKMDKHGAGCSLLPSSFSLSLSLSLSLSPQS